MQTPWGRLSRVEIRHEWLSQRNWRSGGHKLIWAGFVGALRAGSGFGCVSGLGLLAISLFALSTMCGLLAIFEWIKG